MTIRDLTNKKVLVCGGRHYKDFEVVRFYLDRLIPKLIICGGAAGADTLARTWAMKRHVEHIVFLPDWGKFGKAAGPLRNKKMLDEEEPDIVLALPGMRGTANMMYQARNRLIPIIDAEDDTIELHVRSADGTSSDRYPLGWRLTSDS